tara:strand:+ start:656 stop:841 length:186 start_codon:yes stop_codon:yes gene_type:complete
MRTLATFAVIAVFFLIIKACDVAEGRSIYQGDVREEHVMPSQMNQDITVSLHSMMVANGRL